MAVRPSKTELFSTGDMSGVHYITYFVYPTRTVSGRNGKYGT